MMKNNFFEQLKDSKIEDIQKRYKAFQIILYMSLSIFLILLELVAFNLIPINDFTSLFIGASCILLFVVFVLYTVFAFKKNSYCFRKGDISSGIKNYIISGVVVYIVLLVLYFTNKDLGTKSFIASLFAPVTTVLAAILAIMGVHYTLSKQQKNLIDKNKLAFIEKLRKGYFEIDMGCDSGHKDIKICLHNVSDNLGYFVGLFKVAGCDVYELNKNKLYQPILPQKSYMFFNICTLTAEEELFLVYKDIGDNYYYIAFQFNNSQDLLIRSVDSCDVEFLNERIEETEEAEFKATKKQKREPKMIFDGDHDAIKNRKEETKPINVKLVDGYELIKDDEGNIITDTKLLSRLKNERSKIARENKVRAYMVFNNQQLVAIATYKPTDRENFISIFGLGERKYELYGEQMIKIVKEFNY